MQQDQSKGKGPEVKRQNDYGLWGLPVENKKCGEETRFWIYQSRSLSTEALSSFTVLIMGKENKTIKPDVRNVPVFETIPKVHMLFTNKE